MSYAEDMGFDAYSMEDFTMHNLPGEWTTKEGEIIKISDISTSHLRNILRMFESRREFVDNYDDMVAEYQGRVKLPQQPEGREDA